jgi:fatty acid desaturase
MTQIVARLSTQDSVRDSMPRAFALPLTLLTGQPHTGQRPIRFTPTTHLANAVLSMVIGLGVSGVALWSGGWWLALLLVGWAMTLHGMRNLRMMVLHQCAHRNMWARKKPDALVGRMVAGLLLVQHFDRYSKEHVADHHSKNHMTLQDPTVQAFLVSLELKPGMSRGQMWRRLVAKLLSPRFHLRFLIARVRSYFHDANTVERVLVPVGYATVAALATVFDGWVFLLVAYLLPLTFFYQVSNTLRLCVKHTFPSAEVTERRGKEYFGSLTNAIFLGEPAPATDRGRPLAWVRWWLRMLLVHFPARYLVLTGDTVCHDFHHRRPMSRQWANYIFERARDIEAGHPGWPPYQHVWGLVPAIDTVFASLAVSDPAEYSRERLAEVNHRELFAAFDD